MNESNIKVSSLIPISKKMINKSKEKFLKEEENLKEKEDILKKIKNIQEEKAVLILTIKIMLVEIASKENLKNIIVLMNL